MSDRNAFANKETLHGVSSEAFWEHWEAHQAHLFGLCLRWSGGDSQDAHDLVGNVMIRAFEARESAPPTAFRAWATRIARNLFLDHQRSSTRHAHVRSQDDARSRQADPVSAPNPEQDLLRREQLQQLLVAFGNLPLRIRTPMVMRCVQDKPYRDIAKEIQISDAHARKLVQQGREQLRQQLKLPAQVDPLAPAKSETWLLSLIQEEECHTEYPPKPHYAMPVLMRHADGGWREEMVFVEDKPGRLEQKLQSLERYVSRFSSGWKKRVELAEVLLLLGRRADAITQLERVLKRQPQRTFLRLMLANHHLHSSNPQGAVQVLKGGLEQTERKATLLHLRGCLAYAQGDLEEASNLIKQALVMEPAERTHLLMLARIAAEQGAYWMAWEHLREALISDAQDIEVLHLAMEVLSQGQLQGLFQGLSRHLTENASHTALAQAVELRHLLLTQPEVLSTEVRRRMRQLGQAIGQCTDWSELRLLHLYQQRKDSQGLAFLRQAASQADASLQMRLLALRWAGKLGDTPWVVQLAFRLERDFADDRLVMEQVLLHGHDSPAWPQWASLAQAQWSKDVRILYSLSMGALARGEAESALDHALACVALQPNHLGAWLVAAKAAKALGRFDDAQRHVRSAWSSPAMAWSPFIAVECALLMADISGQEGGKGANIEWLELAARISASAAEHDPARAMHYRSLALAGLGDSAGAATALANAQRHGWRDGSLW